MPPLLVGQISLIEDSTDTANQLACTAIHAFLWVDIQGATPFVDTVHGTLLHTRPVHHVHTGGANHICHDPTISVARCRMREPKCPPRGDERPASLPIRFEAVRWRQYELIAHTAVGCRPGALLSFPDKTRVRDLISWGL